MILNFDFVLESSSKNRKRKNKDCLKLQMSTKNKRTNKQTNKRTNEQTIKRTKEQKNKQTNEQTNKRTKEQRTFLAFKRL